MKHTDSPSPTVAPPGVAARLAEVESALACLADGLVPERVAGHELERVMGLLGRIERRAGGARLVLAQAAADAGGWKAAGARSAAEHLARQSGTTLGEAQADLATSKRLGVLPAARAAAGGGELSKAKTRAVAEGAAADPDAEADLVATAKNDDLGAVRDKARRARQRADQRSGKAARRRYLRRGLRLWSEIDGEGRGMWNVPAEFQAAYAAALEPYRDEAFRLARQAGTRPSPEALMADAFQLLCLDVLADHDLDAPEGFFDPACPDGPCAGDPGSAGSGRVDSADVPGTGRAGGPATPSDPRPGGPSSSRAGQASTSGPPPTNAPVPAARRASARRFAERRRTGGNRRRPRQVIVRVDHSALVRGSVEGAETCEIPGIGPVPISAVRRMCDDAILRVIVTRGVDVTAISTTTRYIAADVQRALDARDPECVVPGCRARHHLQNHHWRYDHAQGSPTDTDHLARMRLSHESGASRAGERARATMVHGRERAWFGPGAAVLDAAVGAGLAA